jgi:hypothetical protein
MNKMLGFLSAANVGATIKVATIQITANAIGIGPFLRIICLSPHFEILVKIKVEITILDDPQYLIVFFVLRLLLHSLFPNSVRSIRRI